MNINDFNENMKNAIRIIELNLTKKIASFLAPFNVTKTQADILICLINEGAPLFVNKLSEYLNMPASNISNTCTRLEDNGLVERIRGEKDKRLVKIKLTAKGEKIAIASEQALTKGFMEIAFNTSEGDRILISDGLKKFGKILA